MIGSESIPDGNPIFPAALKDRYILSLDFNGEDKLGGQEIFKNHADWPRTVIIMNLSRVGSHHGPDIQKLTEYRIGFPERNFVAAGGIRNDEDLAALKSIGIKHAMVASALHSGAINRESIRGIC